MKYGSLDSFQREVLEEFFRRENRFFLTGGAALAGFHGGHRSTKDLDLFTTGEHLDDGVEALHAVAGSLGSSIEAVRTAPSFRRFLVRRGEQAVVVDLVHDLAPQVFSDKPLIGSIRVDPPEEILANKLCALLSRAELRDLVDIYFLDQGGFSIEEAVVRAAIKDGGMTHGQLAWILSEIEIGDDAKPPGGVSVQQLREFIEALCHRLAAMAYPDRDS